MWWVAWGWVALEGVGGGLEIAPGGLIDLHVDDEEGRLWMLSELDRKFLHRKF